MTPHGYSLPLSPEGRSSVVPPPPWHYVGVLQVVEFHADPQAVRALLPPGLEPHSDAGRCAAVFADWQSHSEDESERLDPSRSQYKEFFLVCSAMLGDEEVTTCPYIWVDRDFAMIRGWIQGFPKKLGEVWITREWGLDTRADPGIRAGAAYGGTCTASGRRIAQSTVTLEHVSAQGSTVTSPPLINVRHFPRLAAGQHDRPAVHELARITSRDRALSEVWEGAATLELFDAPNAEVGALAPVAVGRGFRFTLGYTVDDLGFEGDLRPA